MHAGVVHSQAGLPAGLRTADKDRFMPRLGFAYRPFNNDKTAIRAGAGMYNITTLGAIFYALTGTLQAGTQTFLNQNTATGPAYQWPALSAGGSGYGAPHTAPIISAPPTTSTSTMRLPISGIFSVDHEFAGNIALRASYIGMRVNHFVWAPSYNDMSYSDTTAATDRPLTDRPFPNWGIIDNRASSAIYSPMHFSLKPIAASATASRSTPPTRCEKHRRQPGSPAEFRRRKRWLARNLL